MNAAFGTIRDSLVTLAFEIRIVMSFELVQPTLSMVFK